MTSKTNKPSRLPRPVPPAQTAKKSVSKGKPEKLSENQDSQFMDSTESEQEEDLNLAPESENGLLAGDESSELGVEDPLDLSRVEFTSELSEDPVRLYLREIGQVKLLDATREFRLAAMIEARRMLLLSMRKYKIEMPPHKSEMTIIYQELMHDLQTALQRFAEDKRRYRRAIKKAGRETEQKEIKIPEPINFLEEAQDLSQGWEREIPSYLHALIEQGEWGKDQTWDSLVSHAYIIFVIFYLLTDEYRRWLKKYFSSNRKLPALELLIEN